MDKKIIIIITIIIILALSITAFLLLTKSSNEVVHPKTCDLECDNYHYSNCPEDCIQRCISSSCSGNICTDDCDGSGSCACP